MASETDGTNIINDYCNKHSVRVNSTLTWKERKS